ncbi:hypothetical protein BpHYR1_051453 [Brachionus plicatilis]|uniref:Uncharacterized protein n=1 Tax=Brachionus plicatilis TaxID=10195 RepID=A0A3M7SUA3_BRAPC|nr:hypothetical protein BpHYR1_051453 [Brachionus plicatilis]
MFQKDNVIIFLGESESILGSLFGSNPGSEVDPCEEQDLSEEESVEKSESVTEETGSLTVKEGNVCDAESESESDQEKSRFLQICGVDPTTCPLCGELMKNDKGVKLHINRIEENFTVPIIPVVLPYYLHEYCQIPLFMFHVVGIFSQNSKTFEHWRQRNEFVSGQFGTFTIRQQHGRSMSLKAGDGFWLAGLTDHVNCLTNTHCDRQRHSGLHGQCQIKEHVMRFGQNNVLYVQKADQNGQQTANSYSIEQKFVAMIRRYGHGAFSHMSQALRQTHHEQVVLVFGMIHGQLS